MNVLFTGRGTSGSWIVRGEQLGGAVGTAKPKATLADMKRADLVVLIKRPAPGQIDALQHSGKPWVWDVVDFYPQPGCTAWSREQACGWVRKQINAARPHAVIWPNGRMSEDCGGTQRDLVLYHHHRPGIARNPIREQVQVLGYEGSAAYLGRWESALRSICRSRGWRLAVNEGTHAGWDICLAFRDRHFDGYAQRNWKSNVKLANCHGSGTPFIGARENGYLETQAGGEVYCSHPRYLIDAIASLESVDARRAVSESFLGAAYSLESAAADLKRWIDQL